MSTFYYSLLFLVFFILVLLAVFLYLKIRILKRQNKLLIRQNRDLNSISLPDETNYYKLDPHLLKNALNAIQSHAYQSYHALDKLSNVLDYILYETDGTFVKLKDEIAFAQNLIEINKLKISPLFDLHIRKKISAEAGEMLIAPFMTINPIENAFKHADVQNENSFISVVFEVIDDYFHLTVSNRVMQKQKIDSSLGGLGNKTFSKRLKNIYGTEYSLNTEQKENIYTVTVKIKLYQND
ncbi:MULTISPECIES: sensor histidine kinase [Sphingobacterium]|uniref:sensor histidine kinase n=1 Tax=Sphingobacterium TaxID=28453 RepID=UPI001047EECB|nr:MULTISPECIES: histidine kinase [Sphingobacterium]MCS3553747.1 LytS/YehU family sensor histidine kinase [Sphingobacterium sp. JUb21]MCW2260688.1 LytS/YehU family sensor histidine kinase [Sphingobacterium kitahiroshimense]TCR01413.1 histidine kinase [Sphingobacterium sp. JUb20]TCR08986.1 histidine kinase [Sphingobacterium sp. JUb78]